MTKRAQHDGTAVARLRSKQIFPSFTGKMVTGLAIALLPFSACTADSPTDPTSDGSPSEGVVSAEAVEDFAVLEATDSTITVRWTQVDDGKGDPARYQVKYATPPIDWSSAEVGCEVAGDEIGAEASCTIGALEPSTTYDFQLMSHGLRGNSKKGATYSDVMTGETTGPTTTESTDTTQTTDATDANSVTDLRITDATESTLTVRWTEVDDGTGEPAQYRVKYAVPSIDYGSAEVGCELAGNEVGTDISCAIEGLDAGTTYDVQLMSYRLVDGQWENAAASNVATEATAEETSDGEIASDGSDSPSSTGIWLSQEELEQQPTSGAAWDRIVKDADRDPGIADIADMHSHHDVYTLAAALVCARTDRYCSKAQQGILDAIGTEDPGNWLAVGRNLASYVIAADVLDLRADGTPDSPGTRVEEWIEGWLTKRLPDNITGELRGFKPFGGSANAMAQEGLVYTAVAAYLQDDHALLRAWDAFRTFACDPSAPDRENIYLGKSVADGWTHDDQNPCAINPAGTTKEVPSGAPGAGSIRRIDGALTGDMRRGGTYQWEPGYTQYPWVGLEGFVPAATLLDRAGFPAFEVADRAVLRTHEYLWFLRSHTGDTRWFDGDRARSIVQLVNAAYGESFPVNGAVGGGRTVGYTDWTHPTP